MQRPLISALAAAIGFCAFAIAPANAATESFRTERVSYAGLDLNHDAGANVMLRRIQFAAREVCGDRTGRMSLRERAEIRACTSETMSKAVAAVGNDNLTRVFYGRPTITIGMH
ncbi:MAG: UrcA family protein [Hyphomonadaceae bacterium]